MSMHYVIKKTEKDLLKYKEYNIHKILLFAVYANLHLYFEMYSNLISFY